MASTYGGKGSGGIMWRRIDVTATFGTIFDGMCDVSHTRPKYGISGNPLEVKSFRMHKERVNTMVARLCDRGWVKVKNAYGFALIYDPALFEERI